MHVGLEGRNIANFDAHRLSNQSIVIRHAQERMEVEELDLGSNLGILVKEGRQKQQRTR